MQRQNNNVPRFLLKNKRNDADKAFPGQEMYLIWLSFLCCKQKKTKFRLNICLVSYSLGIFQKPRSITFLFGPIRPVIIIDVVVIFLVALWLVVGVVTSDYSVTQRGMTVTQHYSLLHTVWSENKRRSKVILQLHDCLCRFSRTQLSVRVQDPSRQCAAQSPVFWAYLRFAIRLLFRPIPRHFSRWGAKREAAMLRLQLGQTHSLFFHWLNTWPNTSSPGWSTISEKDKRQLFRVKPLRVRLLLMHERIGAGEYETAYATWLNYDLCWMNVSAFFRSGKTNQHETL